jgi:mannitol 2-dehydrogenase
VHNPPERSSSRRKVKPHPLTGDTLASLGPDVAVPTYDRSALTPAIVHIGVGGFHRAHQGTYLDALARLGETGWGEIGVGLRSPAMRDALVPQDLLYTVVERDAHHDSATVVGAMVGYLYAPDDPEAVLSALADERTRLVTLTITGGAYPVDDDGRFRPDDELRADAAGSGSPSTAWGYLVAALERRRAAGLPAFTVLSCDNVPDNGAATRSAVLGVARLRSPDLAAWIAESASFPGSMVDRITPTTDDATRELVAERFGIVDRSPVVTEPFTQWVVEDDFCNGRPPFERVGVELVDDVTPHKIVKTRLLNASHSALGYLGYLAGHRTTSDAMANPVLRDYLAALMRENIAPLLPEVESIDLDGYQASLLERFANPRISDALSRLCGRGSVKMPAYLLPSLMEARRIGSPATLLTLAVAGWYCYLRGYDLSGDPIEIADVRRDELQSLVVAGGEDPRLLLGERAIFGDLAEDVGFIARLREAVRDLREYGAAAVICDGLVADLVPAA